MLAKAGNQQDLRVRRTRRLLQEKFWELLTEKSFQSITVQDITEQAMVNRATFYDHFADKYALLQYSIHEWFKETLHGQIPDEFVWSVENMERLILTACEFLSQLRHHCMPRDQQVLPLVQTTITALMSEILLSWIDEAGQIESHEPGPDLAAAVTSWAIYGAALYWSQEDRREPVEEYVRRVLPLIMGSLGGLATTSVGFQENLS
jgi:AcrR family transcriptional regulator